MMKSPITNSPDIVSENSRLGSPALGSSAKRHVRFKLPDTAEDDIIYPEPLASYSTRICARCRKYWRPVAIDAMPAGAISFRGTSSAPPAPLLLSHPPPSPLNSNPATDNKSLSSYKDDAEADTATVFISTSSSGSEAGSRKSSLKTTSTRKRSIDAGQGDDGCGNITRGKRRRRRERSGQERDARVQESRCLETVDEELLPTTSAVHVTTARDTYGHHAHTYRHRHEAYETVSAQEGLHNPLTLDYSAAAPLINSSTYFDQYVDGIMDNLSTQSATEVPIDIDIEAENSLASCLVLFDEEQRCTDDDPLRSFVVDKKSIVLDSLSPDISPHIVITSPSDPWDGCWASTWNCPLPQDEQFLEVPPLWYGVPPYTPSYAAIDYYASMGLDLPQRLCRRIGRFTVEHSTCVNISIAEREASSTYRRLYKIAAITASVTAARFSARWDAQTSCSEFETSFSWSDPAQPFLAFYGKCRDARIIDSTNPFIAPHIIIHEVPDQHPWEACHSQVPPQHCGFLMVPGALCPCHPLASEPEEMTIVIEAMDAHFDLEDNSDDVETETEIGSETDEEGLSLEESDSESSYCECLDTPRDGMFCFAPSLPAKHAFTLEEDEEDLPPFDEWYQDIASRTC